MITVHLYWNHICVLHRREKAHLEALTARLAAEDIDLRVRYFGLGYPEHMSEYLARPDAVLPDIIISADLEVFENTRIFSRFRDDLYEACSWLPLRQSPMLNAVERGSAVLPVLAIPLVYFTREPERARRTPLADYQGLAFGGINNSVAKTVVKVLWEQAGKETADAVLDAAQVSDMPIGAFQAVRTGSAQTALVPSLYAASADGSHTFIETPMEGPVLIPSYFCARKIVPEQLARRLARAILSTELLEFYAAQGDLIVFPEACTGRSRQEGAHCLCPTQAFLEQLSPDTFYDLYCRRLPAAVRLQVDA